MGYPKPMPILFSWGLLLAALMTTDCTTSGNPEVINQAKVAQIQVGKSTQENVRSAFGAPQHVTKRMDAAGQVSESWDYGYSRIETDPVAFIPIVGLFVGKSTANIDGLGITFTSDGIVSQITRHSSRAESGPEAKPGPGTMVISR